MKLKVSIIFEATILYKFNATNICIMEGQLCMTNIESKGAYFEKWGNINCPKPFLILMDFVYALLNGKKVGPFNLNIRKTFFYSDNNKSLE